MDVEITPEPSDEERSAILAALDLAEPRREQLCRSRWRASGLDELRGDAAPEDAWGDPGVVEP